MNTQPQLPGFGDDAPPPLALRKYQEEALEAIKKAQGAGINKQLLVLPTGAGKTVVFAELVKRMGEKALIMAHREELIEQAKNKLRAVLDKDTSVGVVKAEHNQVDADVLVCSIQTIWRARRLAALPRDLGLVIIDEAHHAAAATYGKVLDALVHQNEYTPLLLGVTATPDRGDGKKIGKTIFDAPVYQKAMKDLIDEGYLAPVTNKTVRLALDFGSIKTKGGDYDSDDLEAKLTEAGAVGAVIKAYQTYGEGRKTLAFTPGVKLAHQMAAAAREAGIAAESLDGTTPAQERRDMLARFASGQTTFLANCGVLTEGFDEPSIGCLVMCRPTRSRPLFVQMLGRGMRIYPGKRDVLALDVTGISAVHNVVTVPDVFDEDEEDEPEDVDLDPDESDGEEATGSRPPQMKVLYGQNMGLEDIDLFNRPVTNPNLKNVHWVPVRGGATEYVALPLGDGAIKVGQDRQGRWAVVYNAPGKEPMVVKRTPDMEGALLFAYQYAYQFGYPWAYKARLRWREKPVSLKTRALARHLGVILPATCTAGEASDQILVHQCLHGFVSA